VTALRPFGIDQLRHELEPLTWEARFDRLAVIEKQTAEEDRPALRALRDRWAEVALADIRASWGALPLKEGVLRLPSKKMRAALGRAAKQARDRHVEQAIATGGPPLGGQVAPGCRFAVGLDERALEVPLALEAMRLDTRGEVLDAGSALNLPIVRHVIGRPAARMTHFTLPGADEPVLPGDDDRYCRASGDLRDMPFPSGTFDRIACVSTLEHVGMDNSRYGGDVEQASPSADVAVRELIRVLAPGGTLLITVPYGQAADHGWFRVFDATTLAQLLVPANAAFVRCRYFYYDEGWLEGGPVPPPSVLDLGFSEDVVTGIAVAYVAKSGERS